MRTVFSSLNVYDLILFVQIVEIHYEIAVTWNYFGRP